MDVLQGAEEQLVHDRQAVKVGLPRLKVWYPEGMAHRALILVTIAAWAPVGFGVVVLALATVLQALGWRVALPWWTWATFITPAGVWSVLVAAAWHDRRRQRSVQ